MLEAGFEIGGEISHPNEQFTLNTIQHSDPHLLIQHF